MKKGIHPEYRDVVFKDVSCDFEILTKSTIKTTDKTTFLFSKLIFLLDLTLSTQEHNV